MNSDFTFAVKTDDFSAEEKVIRNGLNAYADEEAQLLRDFAGIFCHDGEQMIGGVTSHLIGGSLSVKLLWVDKAYRGKGIGETLMRRLEAHALEKDCKVSFVDTMSYQAPEFYKRIGYSEVARISKFYAVGHDRVFYKKDLG